MERRTILICIFIFFVLIDNNYCKPYTKKKNKLLLILLDGFRYDYVDGQPSENLPGFTRFLSEGVRAKWLNPVYPSISYPDWTTLVTGLWPESHGILGNHFYDSVQKDLFTSNNDNTTDRQKWWTAEPIWTTATKNGVVTSALLWGRCNVPIDDVLPHFCTPYIDLKGYERFKTDIEMSLQMLEDEIDFAMTYTLHLDSIGHNIGPESNELLEGVRDIDSIIGYLQDRLDHLNMTDKVNIVIVSDHGMLNTSPGDINRVELDEYLLSDSVELVVDRGAFTTIQVKPDDGPETLNIPKNIDKVFDKLSSMPGVDIYKKEDIPENLHYKNNQYVLDILIKAKPDTLIMSSKNDAIMFPNRNYNYTLYGGHGWLVDEEPQMRGIFFAKGPDFQSNLVIPEIDMVDVYPLLVNLLDIPPNPNNGSFAKTKEALTGEYLNSASQEISGRANFGIIIMLLIFSLGAFES